VRAPRLARRRVTARRSRLARSARAVFAGSVQSRTRRWRCPRARARRLNRRLRLSRREQVVTTASPVASPSVLTACRSPAVSLGWFVNTSQRARPSSRRTMRSSKPRARSPPGVAKRHPRASAETRTISGRSASAASVPRGSESENWPSSSAVAEALRPPSAVMCARATGQPP
jgi:hypothetical protein